MNAPTFLRRLGPKSVCFKTEACPDILELADGDFAVIGLDITGDSVGRLPAGSGCGQGERIVRIPRKVLVQAITDIL
jgi:hypothetical protein